MNNNNDDDDNNNNNNNINNNNNNNNNFAFQIYALGQNFVKSMNLYLHFFSTKIVRSFNAKNTLATKNPLDAVPEMNADKSSIQHFRCDVIVLWPSPLIYGLFLNSFLTKNSIQFT